MKKHHQICLLAVGLLLTLTAGCNNEPARPTVQRFQSFTGENGSTYIRIFYGPGEKDDTSKWELMLVPATGKCASELEIGRPLPKSCVPLFK